MPIFKVCIHAPYTPPGQPRLNPFLIRDLFSSGISRSIKEFRFEAKDENEVKRLFQEAIDNDLPNVRGYTLRSIEEVDSLYSPDPRD